MLPRPKSPYAVQKLMGEYYASVFHSCFGLETVSLRFFNVYGERQDPSSPYSGVLSLFMRALIERRSPTIFGDGEQTRDFTYVEDVAGLCMKASSAPGVGRQDVQRRQRRTILAESHLGSAAEDRGRLACRPSYAPPREGDVRDSQADTTAAQRDLGHDPQYTLEQGLRRTLAWYRAQ